LRPSKVAATALLARAYLSMRNYDSAFKYADLCLSKKNDLIDYNNDTDLVANFISNLPPFRQFNKETIFYSETSTILNIHSPDYANIDTILYLSYSDDDLRKQAFFTQSGVYNKFKGTYSQNRLTLFSGIATDEIFLIRSECYARRGNIAAALYDLNSLLIKRWRNGTFHQITATTTAQTLGIILIERRKELVMRCLRWMDVKRQNKEGVNITLSRRINAKYFTLPPNDNRYALPLPKDIIEITGMLQNPR